MGKPLFAQYTTPTLTVRVPEGCDLTLADDLYFGIKQSGGVLVEKHKPDVVVESARTATVYFSQEETGRLLKGLARIELDPVYTGGRRGQPFKADVQIDDTIFNRVLP